jgi:hypothetical protein
MENIKLEFKNCHLNCIHNLKLNKKYKMKAGSVSFKGEILEGNESIDVSTRNYYVPNGHSWIETEDGQIIDWAMNRLIKGSEEIKMFDKIKLEKLGIIYTSHINEKAIVNKIKKYYTH